MSTTTLHHNPPSPQPAPASRSHRAVREGALLLTALACIPYLVLKTAWVFGSHIGIPAGSELLDHETLMRCANGLTIVMDATALTLAFGLARGWGRRLPGALLLVPLWVASGLLAPIVVAFPLEAVFGSATDGGTSSQWLQPWVFTVVYSGFCLQAVGLGTLMVLYALRRWGHLWRGSMAVQPFTPTTRAARLSVVLAGIIATYPLVMHVLWALGVSWPRAQGDGTTAVVHIANALLIVLAFWGAGTLVFGHSPRLNVRVPLVAAWIGAAALGAFGMWMLLGSVTVDGTLPDDPPLALGSVYGSAAAAGMMLLVAGAHLLTERASYARSE